MTDQPVRHDGLRRLRQSAHRVLLATLVAVPATAALTGLLLLVPPSVALLVCLFGLGLFKSGGGADRPAFVVIGGVVMWAAILAWAIGQ